MASETDMSSLGSTAQCTLHWFVRASTDWVRLCVSVDGSTRVWCDDRFVGGGARNQEPDGDIRRRDSDLDRFGPSDRRNTLRPVSLVYCIIYEMCPLGDPYPRLI